MSDAPPRLYSSLAHIWHLFSPPEEYAEEVDTFRRRFIAHGIPDGGSILHLGSGGGSIDYHLKRWYNVVGVDLSREMIGQAQAVNPEVRYIQGDIRDVRVEETFDAVLVHDAISYMTSTAELEAVYRTAAAHLDAGGLLIALPEELRERLRPGRAEAETRTVGDTVLSVMETSHDPDPADHAFEVVYVFLIRKGEELRVEVDRHVNGVFELDEFLAAVRAAGFDADAERWELTEWGDAPEMPLIVGAKR